jgi:PhnB protein
VKINVYLNFHGNCREALEYYQNVLGGQIDAIMRHRGTPAEEFTPPDWLDKIMHGRLVVGDAAVIMGSDSPPQYQEKPGGFGVCISTDNIDEGKRIFAGLSDGGSVSMPYEETFWAKGFGMCTDRFGIDWMINGGEKQMQ